MASTHIDLTLVARLSSSPCTTLSPLPHGHAERAPDREGHPSRPAAAPATDVPDNVRQLPIMTAPVDPAPSRRLPGGVGGEHGRRGSRPSVPVRVLARRCPARSRPRLGLAFPSPPPSPHLLADPAATPPSWSPIGAQESVGVRALADDWSDPVTWEGMTAAGGVRPPRPHPGVSGRDPGWQPPFAAWAAQLSRR